MVPKLEFRRSWIYDVTLQHSRNKKAKQPSYKEFKTAMSKLQKEWEKVGPKVLAEMSKVLKLKWHQRTTTCYVSWGIRAFSDPLTINLNKKVSSMIDVIVHEMVHRLLSEDENIPIMIGSWKRMMTKYNKYAPVTRGHIPVHAVHEHLFRKMFSVKRLNEEIEWAKKSKLYTEAWDVVKRDGYKNIIDELTNGYRHGK
jgi:hypothetical protein